MPEGRGMQYNRSQRMREPDDSLPRELAAKLANFKEKGLRGLKGEAIVEIADKLGKFLKNKGLKTTQIRRFLDGIRRIDAAADKDHFKRDDVVLLKPKLAYAAGRDQRKVKPLMEVLNPAIDAVKDDYNDFKKLINLIESIVAYHKFYGGE